MIRDLLLPATDAGVIAQLGLVTSVSLVALAGVWRNADFRILVIGLTLLAVALIGVRAIH